MIGIITIFSGLLALASVTAIIIGVNYNFGALSDPMLILNSTGIHIGAARWSMILDMFGYYLLLVPAIFLLQDWSKNRSAWSRLFSFTGLCYVLVGSMGAAILAVVWPNILQAYPAASAAMQEILKGNYKLANDLVYGGLWNLLEMLFAGTWWLFCGTILYREKFLKIGLLTGLLGISCLAGGLASICQLDSMHEIALNIYLVLAIIWAIATGTFLLRSPLK